MLKTKTLNFSNRLSKFSVTLALEQVKFVNLRNLSVISLRG